jgi:hypothetical protein
MQKTSPYSQSTIIKKRRAAGQMKQRGSTGVRKMSVKFYVLAGAVVATGFFAAGSAHSALVSGASQHPKLDRVSEPGRAGKRASLSQTQPRTALLPAQETTCRAV